MVYLHLVSLLYLFLFTTNCFYLEVTDTTNKRQGLVWGTVRLTDQIDRKTSLIIQAAFMHHRRGEPELTLEEVDVMHPIGHHGHRFQVQAMQHLPEQDASQDMEIIAYQSKKNPTWKYRFHFSNQLKKQVDQIRQFISNHQIEPHIDLFQNIPEHLKEELLQKHEEAIRDRLNAQQRIAERNEL